MKKILSKYNLMTAATIASMSANASIVYTDVDPDQTFTDYGDEYDLDLNNDGTVDFTILNYGSGATYYGGIALFANNYVFALAGSGNSILATQSALYTSFDVAKALRAGNEVSSNQSFIGSAAVLKGFYGLNVEGYSSYNFSYKLGAFNDTVFDTFLGLKFKDGSQDLYGWARLTVDVAVDVISFTIHDYAYDDSGEPIKAGLGIVSPGSVGINEDLILNNVKVSNLDGQLKVTSDDRLNGKVNLINISGQTVKTENINGNELLINSNGLSKGTYIVQIIADDKTKSIKVAL